MKRQGLVIAASATAALVGAMVAPPAPLDTSVELSAAPAVAMESFAEDQERLTLDSGFVQTEPDGPGGEEASKPEPPTVSEPVAKENVAQEPTTRPILAKTGIEVVSVIAGAVAALVSGTRLVSWRRPSSV